MVPAGGDDQLDDLLLVEEILQALPQLDRRSRWSRAAPRRAASRQPPRRPPAGVGVVAGGRRGSSGVPSPAAAPNAAAWTPHSYSAPASAQVRSIITSRRRSGTVACAPRIAGAERAHARHQLADAGRACGTAPAGRCRRRRGHPALELLGDAGLVGWLERARGGGCGGGHLHSDRRASIFTAAEPDYRFSFQKQQGRRNDDARRPLPGAAGPRLRERPADHGAARPARPPLGAARAVGAARAGRCSSGSCRSAAGGMSSSVLNQRLGELRAAGIVERGAAATRSAPRARGCSRSSSRCRPGRERWAERAVRPRASA